MAASNILTPEQIGQLVEYSPQTGMFTWRVRHSEDGKALGRTAAWNRKFAGNICFNQITPKGYKQGNIRGVCYLAHRAAWAISYGSWPDDQIDHINGDRSDNRLSNLRQVDARENARNRRKTKIAASGVTGVTQCPRSGRWQARIGVDGEYMHIGMFDTLSAAAEARWHAERMYGFHLNHGR